MPIFASLVYINAWIGQLSPLIGITPRSFLAIAEEGSLSAAARALKQTQPTLGRQLTALETELGLVLFERVGRGLTLTPTGASLAQHVTAMRDAAAQFSLAASGRSDLIEGPIAITASDISSAYLLPQSLPNWRASPRNYMSTLSRQMTFAIFCAAKQTSPSATSAPQNQK